MILANSIVHRIMIPLYKNNEGRARNIIKIRYAISLAIIMPISIFAVLEHLSYQYYMMTGS